MSSSSDPSPTDLLNMLVSLTQLTQKLDQLQNPAPPPAEVGPADPAQPLGLPEHSPRTLEELLVGLTERLEQFASQAEARGRRLDNRLEQIEKLLAAQVPAKGD